MPPSTPTACTRSRPAAAGQGSPGASWDLRSKARQRTDRGHVHSGSAAPATALPKIGGRERGWIGRRRQSDAGGRWETHVLLPLVRQVLRAFRASPVLTASKSADSPKGFSRHATAPCASNRENSTSSAWAVM